MLLYILGILIVVVGLALSIGLHEVGHLVPAKLFGVRVSQYMIGFGPTLFSRRRGETEYGVKLLPLGGYISMAGMFPPKHRGEAPRDATTGFLDTFVSGPAEHDEPADAAPQERGLAAMAAEARAASAATIPEGEEHRTFYSLSTLKRVVIMFGGPFMNLVIAVVLYAVILCGFGVSQPSTVIGSVSECVVPATAEVQDCTDDAPEAPGAAGGVLPGDRLVSLDGEPIDSWNESTVIIQQNAGRTLDLVVDREGVEATLEVTPLETERYVTDEQGVVQEVDGEPQTQEVGFLGIGPAYETVRQPVTAVLPAVGDNIARVGHLILNLPQRMVDIAQAAFGTEERDPNGPLSVVGVGRLAGEITSLDTIPVLDRASSLIGLLASLNVALFVFNLLPLLPLDGGHIAGAVFERVRRFFAKLFGRPDPGPLDTAKFIPLTFAVIVVFGAMSLLLIYADLVKPISIL